MPFLQSLARLVRRRRRHQPTCDPPPSPSSAIIGPPDSHEHVSPPSAAPPEPGHGSLSPSKRQRLRKSGPQASSARTTVPTAANGSSGDVGKPLPELPDYRPTQVDQSPSHLVCRASTIKRKPVPRAEEPEALPPVPPPPRPADPERASSGMDHSSASTATQNDASTFSSSPSGPCLSGAIPSPSGDLPPRVASRPGYTALATGKQAGHPQLHIVYSESPLSANPSVSEAHAGRVEVDHPGFSETLPPPPVQPQPNPLAMPTPPTSEECGPTNEGPAAAQHSLLDFSEYLSRLLQSPELSQVIQQAAAFREHVQGCIRDGLLDEHLALRVRAAFAQHGYPMADEDGIVCGVISDDGPTMDEHEDPQDPRDPDSEPQPGPRAYDYASRQPDPFAGQPPPNIPTDQQQTGIRPEAQLRPGHTLVHGSKIYVLQTLVSVGIKGTTYTATDEAGNPVAVMVINAVDAGSMENEYEVMKLAAERDEPFLLRLLASWVDSSFLYLVMHQYTATGQMLPSFITMDAAGVPKYFDLYRGAAELISGLVSLHKMGFIHRLLAAESIIVTPSHHLVLANLSGAQRTDAHGHALGAPPPAPPVHEPPECAFPGLFGAHETRAADVWRLGWVLAELFARAPQVPYAALAPLVTARWHAGAEVVLAPEAMAAQLADAARLVLLTRDPLDLGSLPSIRALDPHLFDLLSRMLVRDPRERWTAEQLKTHPYFTRVDWDKLEKCGESYLKGDPDPDDSQRASSETDSDDESAPCDFTWTLPTDMFELGLERHYGVDFARARMHSCKARAYAAQHTDTTNISHDLNDLNDLNDSMHPRRS